MISGQKYPGIQRHRIWSAPNWSGWLPAGISTSRVEILAENELQFSRKIFPAHQATPRGIKAHHSASPVQTVPWYWSIRSSNGLLATPLAQSHQPRTKTDIARLTSLAKGRRHHEHHPDRKNSLHRQSPRHGFLDLLDYRWPVSGTGKALRESERVLNGLVPVMKALD
jgi:hypothetical protein